MSQDRDITRPRPNPLRPYQCGFSEIGATCLHGPTADGHCCQVFSGGCDKLECGSDCTAGQECQIACRKKGDGEDRKNLQSCIPARSHWNWRNVLALNLAILASGILLAVMSLPNHESLFVPGSLSRGHSQILENTLVSERCSLCHASAHGETVGKTQEQLCMKCHTSHMPDAIQGNAHDLTQPQFAALVSFHNNSSEHQLSAPDDHAATRCAQCHVEHHGGDQDLKAITDSRCQACHQQQFSSFSTNHPEFRKFPYDSPRHIAFDHLAHMDRYFTSKAEVFDCKRCHELDSENPSNIRRTANFEQACASCHQQPIKSSMSEGWAVLQLPSLNSSDIRAGGEPLANWPSSALYGYDGKITLPMRLLLSADENVAQSLLKFPQADLSQTKPGDVDQQNAARKVAGAIRQLMQDTALHGQKEWKQRLTAVATTALRRDLADSELKLIGDMVAGLPPDLFRQIESSWFGKSKALANDGSTNRVTATLVSSQDLLDNSDKGSATESAEDLLRGSSTQGLNYQNQSSVSKGPSNPSQTPPSNSTAPKTNPPPNQPNSASPYRPIQPSTLVPPHGGAGAKSVDILSKDDDNFSAEELLSAPSTGSSRTEKPQSNPKAASGKLTAAQLIGEGGWYLDSQLMAVKYMPKGHADPVVAAWVQFAALIDSSRHGAAARSNDEQQAWHVSHWKPGTEAVGGCTECHLLPSYASVPLGHEDWRSEAGAKPKTFTKFNHKPHLTLAVTADCKHCHQFNAAVKSYAELTKATGEQLTRLVHFQAAQQHFSCEFKAMEKSQCNACHRAGGASEGCTQCHNYHIGTSGFEVLERSEALKR